MSQQRYEEHVAVVQMTSPGDKLYTPIQFRGGGHAWEAPEKAVALVAADLQVKRERYAAELARYKVLEAGDQNSGEFKRLKRMMMGYDGPPAQGTHWSEQAKPFRRLPDYPNGVGRVVFPLDAFAERARYSMERMALELPGYVAGGKTLFPKGWTGEDIRSAADEASAHGTAIKDGANGTIKRMVVERRGQKISIDVALDDLGGVSTSYPSWNQ